MGLESTNPGKIAADAYRTDPNVKTKFSGTVSSETIAAAETVKLQIRRTDTSIADTFTVTDVALFMNDDA